MLVFLYPPPCLRHVMACGVIAGSLQTSLHGKSPASGCCQKSAGKSGKEMLSKKCRPRVPKSAQWYPNGTHNHPKV